MKSKWIIAGIVSLVSCASIMALPGGNEKFDMFENTVQVHADTVSDTFNLDFRKARNSGILMT